MAGDRNPATIAARDLRVIGSKDYLTVYEAAHFPEWNDSMIFLHDWQPSRGGPTRIVIPATFQVERLA